MSAEPTPESSSGETTARNTAVHPLAAFGSAHQAGHWYFQPRAFERYRDGWVYRLLGVHWFKRYVPTSGDRMMRATGRQLISPGGRAALGRVWRYEQNTRTIEWRHLLAFLIMGAGILVLEDYLTRNAVLALWVLNGLLNAYPILLQRYNRLRIYRLLRRTRSGQG